MAVALAATIAVAGCGRTNGPPTSAAPPPPSSAPAVGTANAADVKAYLDGLYAHYKTSKDNTFNMFDTKAGGVFDTDTSALLDADTKALKGDLGTLDGDLLCDCQDFVSLKAMVSVQSATPTTAMASTNFVDVGMSDQGTRHADFQLVKTGAGWRIHDIRDGAEPWLRQQLQDEIKSLANGGHAVSGD